MKEEKEEEERRREDGEMSRIKITKFWQTMMVRLIIKLKKYYDGAFD